MKNLKKIAFGLMVGALAIGFSSFTIAKRVNSAFYSYTSSSLLQADIQNRSNYVATASDPCSGSKNVCGVTLPTSQAIGSHPTTADFSGESDNLWASQDNNSAQDGNISMKP